MSKCSFIFHWHVCDRSQTFLLLKCCVSKCFVINFGNYGSCLLYHVSSNLSPVSRLLSHASCLMPPVSCLLSTVSRLLSHISCLLSHVCCFKSPVSSLMSPVSCLLSNISYLKSPDPRLLSHISCLTCPVSRLLSHWIGGAVGRAGGDGFKSWAGLIIVSHKTCPQLMYSVQCTVRVQEFKGARRGIRARAYRNSKVRVEGFEGARPGIQRCA